MTGSGHSNHPYGGATQGAERPILLNKLRYGRDDSVDVRSTVAVATFYGPGPVSDGAGAGPGPGVSGISLRPDAVAVPALASHVRPALILPERETRDLIAAARAHDVGSGGYFAAGPAGVQVWSGPFNGPGGTRGDSVHLGSVDWSYNTPVKHYATIYRAMVTAEGVAAQETTASILARVLALTGLSLDGTRLSLAVPPARDPFHRR